MLGPDGFHLETLQVRRLQTYPFRWVGVANPIAPNRSSSCRYMIRVFSIPIRYLKILASFDGWLYRRNNTQ